MTSRLRSVTSSMTLAHLVRDVYDLIDDIGDLSRGGIGSFRICATSNRDPDNFLRHRQTASRESRLPLRWLTVRCWR
jgi:hypothetical protein